MARKIDILVATHGRPDLLEQTLRSILEAECHGFIGKIVVVENGSREGAEAICATLAKTGPVEYHWTQQANKSAALNHGLLHCSDGIIFMTDDDIIIAPEVLTQYAEKTAAYQCKAYFGGPTKARYEVEPTESIKSLLPASARGWDSSPAQMLERGYFIGFNWAAFKSDLVEAGGFNPDFGPGSRTGATGQESEMQRRLRDLGAKAIYLPDAIVTHEVPAERCNPDWLLKRSFRQGVERGIVTSSQDPAQSRKLLGSDVRRNRLLWLKANLLRDAELRYKQRFFAERIKGFRKALDLRARQTLSAGPFVSLNQTFE